MARRSAGRRRATKGGDRNLSIAVAMSLAIICGAGALQAAGDPGWLPVALGRRLSRGPGVLEARISITPTSSLGGAALYPGGRGDVAVLVTNANAVPVRIDAIAVPRDTPYATGYRDSALRHPDYDCTSVNSTVAWAGAGAKRVTDQTLAVPLYVKPDTTLRVLLVGVAQMGAGAPESCEHTYFLMPSIAAASASTASGATSPGPWLDRWAAAAPRDRLRDAEISDIKSTSGPEKCSTPQQADIAAKCTHDTGSDA